MTDLFRFLLLRPATPPAPKDLTHLKATFTDEGGGRAEKQRGARTFVESNDFVRHTEDFTYAAVARQVDKALAEAAMTAKQVGTVVQDASKLTLAKVVADKAFGTEEQRLANSLVAMKLLSHSVGGDAPALAELARGYSAIRKAAAGDDVALPVLVIDADRGPKDAAPVATQVPTDEPTQPTQDTRDVKDRIARLDEAIQTLFTVPAEGFRATPMRTRTQALRPVVERLDSQLEAEALHVQQAEQVHQGGTVERSSQTAWALSQDVVRLLPDTVQQTLSDVGLDPSVQPLPAMLDALHAQKTIELQALEGLTPEAHANTKVISYGNFFGQASNDYVGSPAGPNPTGHGNIKPVGIGDLLLVKQHLLRYEGGDLAHVENVLKSEHLSRETRRLDRTETTILHETETTKEEQRDTQTTDRFSLKRETSDTIKTDASFKAGVSVDAKYGPFVEVKANADFATSTSSESTAKTASEFSKDVVSRSASKLVERVLERRTTTTITEFEEKYSHGFDNTTGTAHISGYYQWLDKVSHAQVYNYGKRLLFDVTLPEPATNFILAETGAADEGKSLSKPTAFSITADQITAGNYTWWAKQYDVTGLEPPPAPWKTFSKAFDVSNDQSPRASSKSDVIAIDDGYRAKYAHVDRSLMWVDNNTGVNVKPLWQFVLGTAWIDMQTGPSYVTMANETGSVPYSSTAYKMELLGCNIEVFCEATERATQIWQLKTHAAITQGYLAKVQQYEQKLAALKAQAGVVISGRNPIFNTQLITTELRKQCLTLLTAQQFDGFGALELSAEGYAQPNLARTAAQMPYVRFFEQAFEWEHIIYFFYPYFWGLKKAWNHRILLDDVDAAFADFLRAGSARVVFPVRPGFEAAVIHYLETGEIWNGGPPPDISSSLYVPIVKEIQEATGAPGDEKPVGDPWPVALPTTLVQLRPNNDLPAWQKVGETWTPTN